ncbi:MAG: dihydrolipoamide acetyltransferase family protein [Gammaproteobacteria bacterium]|jgi:pyruvate dehydrogenase E2 component (dihydrolipoamide acetyltransferase)|nr:dihydrolipoamide acetyltransferase family protein [Gammaproteobacteria bacterium]
MSALNDLLMPKLGLTMTEGLLAEWCVAPGDRVSAGDVIFVVETDKVANEITAEADGVIGELLVGQGETVPVGAVVARWTGPGHASAATTAPQQPGTASASAVASGGRPASPAEATARAGRVVATPFARRLAFEHGISLAGVGGSGPRGRIKAADVRAALAAVAAQPAPVASAQPPAGARRCEVIRTPSGVEQTVARRMVEAKQQVPHFYLSSEAEISELLSLRKRLNADEGALRLTLNHFLIAAVARALAEQPSQNRIWRDGEIIEFSTLDVGVAVSTERGLIAPVVHDLAGRSLDEIGRIANVTVGRARDGRSTREDLQGGAITISNAGMFDVTYMTSIINPPQSAILGVGSVRELFRPGPDGAPALRREMGLVYAGDHRIHDGVSGLKFLNRVIALLQDPYCLLRSINI